MTSAPHAGRHPNHLVREKSPYLLQHAYNPVDWHPWGEEAFALARREGRPIFLSIGYSTCHWCHVMEKESFENDSVADLLNRYFVPVKVDREERPDVDRIYMTAMQAMGMGGGWPLNVFLTPDLEPFYGGTYFPPDSRHGRAGMMQMLPSIHRAWVEQRGRLEDTGRQVMEALATLGSADSAAAEHAKLLDDAYDTLARTADDEKGGFGTAPKFPSVPNLALLHRYGAPGSRERERAHTMARRQLDAMAAGGIHDQIGGGFHRYSTDREWLVPHFEKMLYDQAQLAWAYLEAYQLDGRPDDAATARGIFDYVARDLTGPDGGFLSAEDADSEGEEGRFYVWTPAETKDVLGADDAALFDHRYGVTAAGNFEQGASILSRVHTLEETAQHFHVPVADAAARLEGAKTKLLAARGKRVRPHLDDKVIASWNGLMISAFARGARVLDDPALAQRAESAAEFAWTRLRNPETGALSRRWRDGEAAGAGQLDDYAHLALGYIDLYEATFDPRWLERASTLVEQAVRRFADAEHGGFFETPTGDPSVRVRLKSDFDGAEIAGASTLAIVLVRLARLLDRDEWRMLAARTLDDAARRLQRHAISMPQMLVAMDLEHAVSRHIVIAGNPTFEDTQDMIRTFNRRFLPHDELLLVDGGARQRDLARLTPFVGALASAHGRATAYVCVDYACRLPAHDARAFAASLDEAPHVAASRGGAK